jgi:hypothetical protein
LSSRNPRPPDWRASGCAGGHANLAEETKRVTEEEISMRTYVKMTAVAFLLMLMPVIAVAASNSLAEPVEAAPLAQPTSEAGPSGLFAKYDGIEGE